MLNNNKITKKKLNPQQRTWLMTSLWLQENNMQVPPPAWHKHTVTLPNGQANQVSSLSEAISIYNHIYIYYTVSNRQSCSITLHQHHFTIPATQSPPPSYGLQSWARNDWPCSHWRPRAFRTRNTWHTWQKQMGFWVRSGERWHGTRWRKQEFAELNNKKKLRKGLTLWLCQHSYWKWP